MRSWLSVVLFIPWALLGGCEENKPVSGTGWGVFLSTHEHDGHKFVSARTVSSDGGVGVMHHPSCECLKGGKP